MLRKARKNEQMYISSMNYNDVAFDVENLKIPIGANKKTKIVLRNLHPFLLSYRGETCGPISPIV